MTFRAICEAVAGDGKIAVGIKLPAMSLPISQLDLGPKRVTLEGAGSPIVVKLKARFGLAKSIAVDTSMTPLKAANCPDSNGNRRDRAGFVFGGVSGVKESLTARCSPLP